MSANDKSANGWLFANNISTNEIAANNLAKEQTSQSQNDIFSAEKIVKQRMYRKKKLYFIKWKDYPESANSWEPAENIYDRILIEIFEKEQSALKAKSGAGSDVSKKNKSSKRNSSTLDKEPQKVSKSLELVNSNAQAPKEQTTNNDTNSDKDVAKKKKLSSRRNDSTLKKQLSQNDSKPSKKFNLRSQIPMEQLNSFGRKSMSSPPFFAHKSSPFSSGTGEGPILDSQGSEFPTAPVITSNTPVPVSTSDNVGANNVRHNNNSNNLTKAQQDDNITLALTINGVTRTWYFQKASFNLP